MNIPTIIECITHTEDCLKKAMELSSPTKKSSAMIADIYSRVELLLSQLETEAVKQKIDYKSMPYISSLKLKFKGIKWVA